MVLLGRAIFELYPSTKLLGGDADQVQFYYDFALDQALDDHVLPLIEEKMLSWIRDKIPFVSTEMLQSNAIDFFSFHKRHAQAEILSEDVVEQRLVGIARSGPFFDWVQGELLDDAGEIKAFKLLEIVSSQGRWRVTGTAESSRDALKLLIKKLKHAQKNHHLDQGEVKSWWVYHPNQEKIVFLKEGIARRREIITQVEKLLDEEGWNALAFVDQLSQREGLLKSLVLESSDQNNKVYSGASLSCDVPFSGFIALFSLPTISTCLAVWPTASEDLLLNVKSSLKLIAKTCRILGFEVSWTLVLPQGRPKRGGSPFDRKSQSARSGGSLFFEACRQTLEELGWNFDLEECKREEDGGLFAKASDQLGRKWELGRLSTLSEKQISALFREEGKIFKQVLVVEPIISVERIMALQLESLKINRME